MVGQEGLCSTATWPVHDPSYLVETEVTYAIQINGKLRATLTQPVGAVQAEVMTAVKALPRVQEYIHDKEILKEIFVQDKLVSLVLKG